MWLVCDSHPVVSQALTHTCLACTGWRRQHAGSLHPASHPTDTHRQTQGMCVKVLPGSTLTEYSNTPQSPCPLSLKHAPTQHNTQSTNRTVLRRVQSRWPPALPSQSPSQAAAGCSRVWLGGTTATHTSLCCPHMSTSAHRYGSTHTSEHQGAA